MSLHKALRIPYHLIIEINLNAIAIQQIIMQMLIMQMQIIQKKKLLFHL